MSCRIRFPSLLNDTFSGKSFAEPAILFRDSLSCGDTVPLGRRSCEIVRRLDDRGSKSHALGFLRTLSSEKQKKVRRNSPQKIAILNASDFTSVCVRANLPQWRVSPKLPSIRDEENKNYAAAQAHGSSLAKCIREQFVKRLESFHATLPPLIKPEAVGARRC